jgi:hypothetical protein
MAPSTHASAVTSASATSSKGPCKHESHLAALGESDSDESDSDESSDYEYERLRTANIERYTKVSDPDHPFGQKSRTPKPLSAFTAFTSATS